MKLIKNAKILTMTGNNIFDGGIVFDEKIRYIGNDFSDFEITEEYDANGLYVMPGLIDSHCHLGIVEDSLGFEGDDANDDCDPVTPHLRAIDAINPMDRCFTDAKNAGVTTVVTGPGSANPISGQFAAIKTDGICIDDMIVKSPCAVKMSLGENPKSVYNSKNQLPSTRMGTAALIRETLYKSREYMTAFEDYYNNSEENDKPEYDIKFESLIPVLKGEIPVKFHAHRADDICTAIRIAKEFGIKYTIEHCTEGELVADVLKRENIGVMVGPTMTDRSKPELKNMNFSTYKALSDKGICVAIITDHPETTIEYLPLCAALAVKHGMDKYKALEAMTVNPAKNCGIDERVGTLEIGKDADFAVFDKLPYEFNSELKMTFINGIKVK